MTYKKYREKPSAFVREILDEEPTWYQEEFLDKQVDRKVFRSGRQVGKSTVASWKALQHAICYPNQDVLITADALRQSRELFQSVRSTMAESNFSDDEWGVDRATQTIVEFDNNSRIICVPTGNDGSKIRGYTADLIIVDEAAFVEDTIFEDVLQPMTFVSGGQIILTSTPWGETGFFYEKCKLDDDWWELQVSTRENPHISEKDVEDYKTGKTQSQIKREVLGEFVSDADSFFPPRLIRECTQTDVTMNDDTSLYLGCDLSASGEDETVLIGIDNDGNVFRVDHFDGVDEKNPLTTAIERICNLDNVYDFERIVVDQTGIGEGPVERLRERLPRRKLQPEKLSIQRKQSIYQTAKAEMEAENIALPHHGRLKDQLEQVGYKTTRSGNLSIHAKDGGHDDFPDAMALAIWAKDSTEGTGHVNGSKKPVTLGDAKRSERANTNRGGFRSYR